MKDYRPEVVAWRWCKPIVNDHGETVGGVWGLGEAPGFLPWWANDPLIRLSDYEKLKTMHDRLLKHLQHLIDQTTPLEPEPGNPMWSRRIKLDEVMAERDKLRVECEKLAESLTWLRGTINCTPENDKHPSGTWISTKHPRITQIDKLLANYHNQGDES